MALFALDGAIESPSRAVVTPTLKLCHMGDTTISLFLESNKRRKACG